MVHQLLPSLSCEGYRSLGPVCVCGRLHVLKGEGQGSEGKGTVPQGKGRGRGEVETERGATIVAAGVLRLP